MSDSDLREFAADVVSQFGYHVEQPDGLYVTAGGLSTLEWAFSILGWDDPHPTPERECAAPGCHREATCGTPTPDGYKRLCREHARVAFARADREPTP